VCVCTILRTLGQRPPNLKEKSRLNIFVPKWFKKALVETPRDADRKFPEEKTMEGQRSERFVACHMAQMNSKIQQNPETYRFRRAPVRVISRDGKRNS
jgi:hypothetical protein